MVDRRDELEFRRCEWVVYGESELDLEFTALTALDIVKNERKRVIVFGYLVWSILRAVDLAFPFEEVII
jgi:hypothetical protein